MAGLPAPSKGAGGCQTVVYAAHRVGGAEVDADDGAHGLVSEGDGGQRRASEQLERHGWWCYALPVRLCLGLYFAARSP